MYDSHRTIEINVAIEFWCVMCGQKHAADRALAGREMTCIACRKIIRVPPLDLPVFSAAPNELAMLPALLNASGAVMLEPVHLRDTLRALRLLEASVVLFVCALAVVAVTLVIATERDGAENLLAWTWKASSGVVATGGMLAFTALLIGPFLRGFACEFLRGQDRFLGGASAITAAQCGLALQGLAWLLAIADMFWVKPNLVILIAFTFLLVFGFLIEFAIVVSLKRLLLMTAGQLAARDVHGYGVLLANVTFGGFAILAIPATAIVAFTPATFRNPLTLYFTLAGVGLVVSGTLLFLAWAWQRILQSIRRRLIVTTPHLKG